MRFAGRISIAHERLMPGFLQRAVAVEDQRAAAAVMHADDAQQDALRHDDTEIAAER